MTESQKKKIEHLIDTLPNEDKEIYREIAEYAVELGYTPSQIKNVHGLTGAVTFSKSKIGRRLCKINPPSPCAPKGKELYRTDRTGFALSFFATSNYSELFQEGVRQEYESLKGSYTGCYGCKEKDGCYTYIYADGKEIVCCGKTKLIELPPINMEHVDEVKTMMKTQDDFWLKQLIV